jgi:hypothetical protein
VDTDVLATGDLSQLFLPRLKIPSNAVQVVQYGIHHRQDVMLLDETVELFNTGL